MLRLLKQKSALSVGLDIGTAATKVVKLKCSKGRVEFFGFKLEPTLADLTETLRNVALDPDTCSVNISVSGPAAIIRYVSFPKMNADELGKALRFEAEKYIPFSISQVNVDASILRHDMPDNRMLVLLAAVKKDFISQRLKLLEEVDIRPDIVEMDSLALINAFNFNYLRPHQGPAAKTIALLNIGASFSNLSVLDDNIPRLTRDIPIGGNNIARKIMDLFGVDLKTAEALKLGAGKENAEKAAQAAEPVLSNLAGEIGSSFDYYESQSASSVTKIFLSGGVSALEGLRERLAGFLGIEVEYWDPFQGIDTDGSADFLEAKKNASQLAVATGLALRCSHDRDKPSTPGT